MKRCRCLVFVFLSFLAFFTAPQGAFPDDSEKDALLEKLRQAREDWIQNAVFCGHFTVRSGNFTSEEEALAAETFDSAIRAHGFIAKLNHKYRQQTIYDHNNAEMALEPLSEETVANDRFCLRVTHMNNTNDGMQFPFEGAVERVPNTPNFIPPTLSEYNSPCSFFSDRIIVFTKTAEKDYKIECTHQEDGRILLTLTKKGSDKNRRTEELTIRTDRDYPLIEQIIETMGTVKIISRVLEWKDCGGFLIPARIRTVMGKQDSRQEKKFSERWSATEWVFDDLGERSPREKDFAVKVKWDDFIVHLKKPWWKRTIHIDKLTDRNYDPEVPDFLKDPETFSSYKKSQRNGELYFRLCCITAGLALIALALVMKYRGRKKRDVSV